MAKYIDADTLIKRVKDLPTWWADGGGYYGGAMKYPEGMFEPEDVISIIENAPAADVVEVVRCKDCKYYAAMVTDMVIGDMETATWGICRQPWFNSDEYDVDEDGFCNCGAKMDKEE